MNSNLTPVAKPSPFPDILIRSLLVAPFERALARLTDIQFTLEDLEDESIQLKGLAVLAVASVETALLDSLGYYYHARPGYLEVDQITLRRAELLGTRAPVDVLLRQASLRVRRLGYKAFSDQLRVFLTEIRVRDAYNPRKPVLNSFIELKETRNALLHTDLKITNDYVIRAGPLRRANRPGGQLKISRKYVSESVAAAGELVQDIHQVIEDTYRDYTRIAAIRRLWEWLFQSPVMKFDDYWAVDETKDSVIAAKGAEKDYALANSEEMLLSVWMQHFNRRADQLAPLTMYSLDEGNQRKLLHLLAVLPTFSLY